MELSERCVTDKEGHGAEQDSTQAIFFSGQYEIFVAQNDELTYNVFFISQPTASVNMSKCFFMPLDQKISRAYCLYCF